MPSAGRFLVDRWGRPAAVGLLVLTLLLLDVPSAGAVPAVPHPFGPVAPTFSPLLETPAAAPTGIALTVGPTSVNLSKDFLGTTVNNEVRMIRGETDAVNATPAHVLVWPGAMAGEDYDPLTNTHYDTYYGTPKTALTNESQFVAMCKAIQCTAIMQVPAEIDSPSFAEAVVNYTEVNLSFRPAYWMIGNEPELWAHWKVAWKNWPSTYTTGPTPTQFGQEVVQYVNAIRHVDNSTPILGLPASGCTCGYWTFEQWIAAVLQVTGNKIQAVAFHEYPAGWLGSGSGTLQGFYSTLQGAAGIPQRLVSARQAVNSSCSGCNVSVFISELGSALSWSTYGAYALGLSGALSIASQLTQSMDLNLTNVDLFATELATTNSWFTTNGSARPDYGLYAEILNHLGTQAFPATLPGLSSTIYGIDTIQPTDQGRRDLLVMNDNITHAVAFTPRFAEYEGASPVLAWIWNGSIHNTKSNATTWVEPFTPNPVPMEFPSGLPANFTLPPQSLVLFEAYPGGGTYLRINQTGVPSPTPWYAKLGDQLYRTTADNLTLLRPSGTYALSGLPIPLPIGGREYVPSERLLGYAPAPLQVTNGTLDTTLSFVPQWRVNVSADPSGGGTVGTDVGWANASQPLVVNATPAAGYAFVRWTGWGPGSYNGPDRAATLVPGGRIIERAKFVPGEQVLFVPYGLPPNTPWQVSIHGFTTSTIAGAILTYEPNGTFGYHVTPIPGYRVLPENGSFSVFGAPQFVTVRFVPITPPGLVFPVTFQVTGLPAGTSVPVTVRGATRMAGEGLIDFSLWNGTYGYSVGYVPGYHAVPRVKQFNVSGGATTVTVPFAPTVYPIDWKVTGLWNGTNWSIVLNGTTVPATSAWVSASLPNGTYPFEILVPPNFTVSPRSGWISVAASTNEIPLAVSLVLYPGSFEASGISGATAWSVRVGSATVGSSADRAAFHAPNGTYTFDVHPPDGYYAVPSHGHLTVAGAGLPVQIQFFPSSNQPSAALVAALSAGALSVSLWIGASVVGGFVLVRRVRRR